MKENYLDWAKNDAKEKAKVLLKRDLSLSEIAIIEEAVTMEQVPSKFDQVMQMNFPSRQYESPKVETIPAGTNLNSIKEHGTYLSADKYASNKLFVSNSALSAYAVQPSNITFNIPVMNAMIKFPMNSGELQQKVIERGIDFIADLMAIDGVQEVLEKYGVEIKPL
jgi:hypothetical protein